ncbi:MAG TPA: ferritin-like domain-containing protein [Polyangiaceae bacterium]
MAQPVSASAPLPEAAPQTQYAAVASAAAKRPKEGPSGTERLKVTEELTYTWDYACTRPDLRILYEKSKDLLWNARTAIDWNTPVDPTAENVPDPMNPLFGTSIWAKLDPKKDIPELRRHQAAYMFSNFLHGEQGALLATSQIVELAPTADAKFYAAAQVFDEARHVEAYDRYLREKIEMVYPISKYLRQLLDMILTDARWDFKFLGMQIMVEGLALGAFGMIHQTTNEPLIKQITQLIMQDESRHVAFGVLSLKDMYKEIGERELRDREDFVILASKLMYERLLGQEVWERLGFPMKECEEHVTKSESMSLFRRLCFSKIVPNVKRLGLLTPYVRKAFEELGVIEYEHWEATA